MPTNIGVPTTHDTPSDRHGTHLHRTPSPRLPPAASLQNEGKPHTKSTMVRPDRDEHAWERLCARKRDEIERDTRLLSEQQASRCELSLIHI